MIIKRKPQYLVPDLLQPGLKLVLCGTAPSTASARAKSYYARPGNRFWPTLAKIGLTPRLFAPQDYAQLLALGIGLTDLCKVHSGVDAKLPEDAFDVAAFWAKMRKFQPAVIAFTSKAAAAAALSCKTAGLEYGLLMEGCALTKAQIYVLCSPSGLATAYFNLMIWEGLVEVVGRLEMP